MKNNRLHYWYYKHISEDMLTKVPFLTPNDMKISPTITINISSNKAVTDKRKLIPIVLALELITGQKGLLTRARCSLATWRLKKGMEIGVKITLNNYHMWNFLDRLIHIVLPSLIYFNKFNKISYDKYGNLAIGLQDINIFPEMEWLRESQHLLTRLGYLTGADIIIVWNNYSQLKINSQYSTNLLTLKSWKICQSSNFQLIV